MPKPVHQTKSETIHHLQGSLMERAGFPIHTIDDCKQLAVLMQTEENIILSPSTIYRFFFKDHTVHSCYRHTLDKFCNFIGYKSWKQFEHDGGYVTLKKTLSAVQNSGNETSLITHCILNNEHKSLFNFIQELPPILSDSKKLSLFKALYVGLFRHKKSNDIFYKKFI